MAPRDMTAGWCIVCAGRRAVERRHINHAGLFLVALCTCGLTLPYWLWVALRNPWRCRACGAVVREAGDRRAEAAYWGETLPAWTRVPAGLRALVTVLLAFGAVFGVLVALHLLWLTTSIGH